MDDVALRLRARLMPALLVALGVGFLAVGLLSYTEPVEAGPAPSEPPVIVTAPPTFRPTPSPRPSGATPVPSPTFPADRLATRIVIPALRIDLAVIRPDGGYPLCDVAMFIQELGQPGQGRATYIYAHAQKGMFLPLLKESRTNDGVRMLGMLVQVYTSDDQLFIYEITEVRRHQLDLDAAVAADTEQLWMQTSEGVRGTRPKLQVVADFLSSSPADPAEAHPVPKPRKCG